MGEGGHWGTSLGGGLEYSPERRKRDAARRRRQEAAWAAKSGPVRVVKPVDQLIPDDANRDPDDEVPKA
ncbi:MAG: hypothetical protein IBX63_09515 [Coriobacteriia bacterium]|nr:hypothetical protein [Coriobacteriia bacterium]